MRFDVVSIFPEYFESPLRVSLLGKAIESGLVEVGIHDLREWGEGVHRKVDDEPFGGGAGMVMTPGPLVDAAEEVSQPDGKIVLFSAAGAPLRQTDVARLSEATQVVLLCGRYEGVDERVASTLRAEEFSVGEFVLAGGEVAALVFIEAAARLVSGVVGNVESLIEESFSGGSARLLEYPQYTRPADFRGLSVPEVLRSGDHARVASWRREQSLRRTLQRRPHLIDEALLTDEEKTIVEVWRG